MTILGMSDFLFYIIFCSQGVAMFIVNGLLLTTLLFEPSFRKEKEMLIIAGMAGTDMVYALGTITVAIYRLIVILLGVQDELMTAWECMILSPWALLQIGCQLSSVVNVVLSSDRLIAVTWPFKYRTLGARYSGRVMALIALFGFCSLAVMLTTTYFDTSRIASIPKMCALSAFSYSYSMYNYTVLAGSGLLSVFIYIGVFVVFRRTMNQIASHTSGQQERAVAQQRRLTVTLGIITLSTLFLVVIPNLILIYFAFTRIVFPYLAIFGLICRFSTISNVAIYVYRQKEVQTAMWKLVTCKKSTPSSTVTTT